MFAGTYLWMRRGWCWEKFFLRLSIRGLMLEGFAEWGEGQERYFKRANVSGGQRID